MANDRCLVLTQSRNKALVLIGFWRGFRSDELSRLRIEHIQVAPGEGMEIFLPRSKSDRQSRGQRFKAPALSRLCPVTAYQDWIGNAVASWANANRWDVKTLMEYVGWKDIHSAMRYIDVADPFSQRRIEQSLGAALVLETTSVTTTTLEIFLTIERYHKRVKTRNKARGTIERICLKGHEMKVLSDDR